MSGLAEVAANVGELAVVERDATRLWVAYQETIYQAWLPSGRVEIKVGNSHPHLDGELDELDSEQIGQLEQGQQVEKGWCFITAWNPASLPLDAAENRQRNLRLRAELDRLGHAVFPGVGRGADPSWQPEESFLVVGIALGISCARPDSACRRPGASPAPSGSTRRRAWTRHRSLCAARRRGF